MRNMKDSFDKTENVYNESTPVIDKKKNSDNGALSFSSILGKRFTEKPSTEETESSSSYSFNSFLARCSAVVQNPLFRTIMYRLFLTAVIVAMALAMTALLMNPAALPVSIAGVVLGLGVFALKAALPVAAGLAVGAAVLLAQSVVPSIYSMFKKEPVELSVATHDHGHDCGRNNEHVDFTV